MINFRQYQNETQNKEFYRAMIMHWHKRSENINKISNFCCVVVSEFVGCRVLFRVYKFNQKDKHNEIECLFISLYQEQQHQISKDIKKRMENEKNYTEIN